VDWKLYAWLKRGSRRKEILQLLSESKKPLTPKEIKNELKISLSQVSFLLKELHKKKLIMCLNPEDNIGRIYRVTKEGEDILHEI